MVVIGLAYGEIDSRKTAKKASYLIAGAIPCCLVHMRGAQCTGRLPTVETDAGVIIDYEMLFTDN